MGKFRKDFVTNSSSSSFICEVSGSVESGYDMGIEDAGMYECENGHTFCENYLVGSIETFTKESIIEILESRKSNALSSYEKLNREYYKETANDMDEYMSRLNNANDVTNLIEEIVENLELSDRDSIPAKNCPICTMDFIRDKDVLNFALDKLNTTRDKICDEIRKSK